MRQKNKSLYELTDDELIDRYCFFLVEIAEAIKLRDFEGWSTAEVNRKLCVKAMDRRKLKFDNQTGRN